MAASGSACTGECLEAQDGSLVSFSGNGVTLEGRVYKPAGAGPFPTIVFLHGCSGLYTGSNGALGSQFTFWGERVRDEDGYAALFVDSFTPRGIDSVCSNSSLLNEAVDRVLDAYAGLTYLRSQPYVNSNAIAVVGWSNGGSTALSAAARDGNPAGSAVFGGFDFSVAVYPGCGLQSTYGSDYDYTFAGEEDQAFYIPAIPTYIFAGSADTTTPPSPRCENITERAQNLGASAATGNAISLTPYSGAQHGYDRSDDSGSWTDDDRTARDAARAAIREIMSTFL